MNQLLNEHVISVRGIDNALKVAKTLLEQDYQVFVQLDDCDIYIIDYNHNDESLGADQFASITLDEAESIFNKRYEDELNEARERLADEDLLIDDSDEDVSEE